MEVISCGVSAPHVVCLARAAPTMSRRTFQFRVVVVFHAAFSVTVPLNVTMGFASQLGRIAAARCCAILEVVGHAKCSHEQCVCCVFRICSFRDRHSL